MIERDELDLTHPSAEAFKTKLLETRSELLQMLEDGLAKSRNALQRTTDQHLERPGISLWEFRFCSMHRDVTLSESLFCHIAHHRGQLTVYLRLNEATVHIARHSPAIGEQSGSQRFHEEGMNYGKFAYSALTSLKMRISELGRESVTPSEIPSPRAPYR